MRNLNDFLANGETLVSDEDKEQICELLDNYDKDKYDDVIDTIKELEKYLIKYNLIPKGYVLGIHNASNYKGAAPEYTPALMRKTSKNKADCELANSANIFFYKNPEKNPWMMKLINALQMFESNYHYDDFWIYKIKDEKDTLMIKK